MQPDYFMLGGVIIIRCLQIEKSFGLARDMVAYPVFQRIYLLLQKFDLWLALYQVKVGFFHGGDKVARLRAPWKIEVGIVGIALHKLILAFLVILLAQQTGLAAA